MEVDLAKLLAVENAMVEWKKGPNAEEVVETLSAFANDLAGAGGGYVLCGVEEHRDVHGYRQPELLGLSAKEIDELRPKVLAWCHDLVEPPITPDLWEIPVAANPSKQCRMEHAALFRGGGSTGFAGRGGGAARSPPDSGYTMSHSQCDIV